MRFPWQRRSYKEAEVDPDEIFLDSQNLPQFDTQRFEGRMEKAIPKYTLGVVGGLCLLAFVILGVNIGMLQIAKGAAFRERSENNRLKQIPFFGDRGAIYDRNHVELAWNAPDRFYTSASGHSLLLGYVGRPNEDEVAEGGYNPEELIGKSGVEGMFNDELRGKSGIKIVETDAAGNVSSESIYEPPTSGEPLTLSIDSRVQNKLYSSIEAVAKDRGFSGGAGVIMDIKTGELLAITSYPEYEPNLFTGDADSATISRALNDSRKPFLNRAVGGVYTPGSIVKPFMALAALAEGTISPLKEIVSTGSISIPNPYDPSKKSVFTDWKAHGAIDMRKAIAVSSNVYFYIVGGGFQGQKGLGIANIQKYANLFGFGEPTGINIEGEGVGVVPSPEWKAENFDGEPWRLGDTYFTSIGQYGFGVTPLQIVRGVAAIANSGKLLTPSVIKQDAPRVTENIPIAPENFQIVQEGMRQGVFIGTAKGLNMPGLAVAAKTGTAELGVSKERVNSWVTGFFPYDNPRYAFAVVMEKGARTNTIGGVFVMRQVLEWMAAYTPEYTRGKVAETPELKES